MWGSFLFLVLHPRPPPPAPPPPSARLRPIHTPLVITPLVITPLVHTQLVITPLVITPLVITPLVITQFVHTQLVITPLVITPRVITQFVITTCHHTTCPHTICHHTTCPHTTCHHTTCPTHNLHHTTCHHTTCHHTTCPHTLVITPLGFTWQAWHLATSIVTLRGRRGTHGTGLALSWRAWSRSGAVVAPSIHVACVALGDIYRHFAWQAWHSRHWAGSGGALWSRFWRQWSPRPFCVAGVALGDIHVRFTAWQAWHLATSIVTLRGRRGTHGTGLALAARLVQIWRRGRRGRFAWQAWHLVTIHLRFTVAGVALGDIYRHFAWQAWHSRHWAGSGGALGPDLAPWSPRPFCLAGVALGDIHVRFTWQAWHLATSIVTLRGRRGTHGTGLALAARLVQIWRRGRRGRFAGQAWHLVTIHLRFTWQAWHLTTLLSSLCAAGVALTALGWLWRRAWSRSGAVVAAAVLRGRRGTW